MKSLKFLGKYLYSSIGLFVFALISAIINVLCVLLIPVYIGKGIDVIIGIGAVQFETLKDYLLIEDNVVIGGDANISCHIFEGRYLILNKIKIGANTLISAEAYLMPGVEVGKNCNIGLKAYVRKNRKIEDGSIIMAVPGVPSKKVAEIISDRKEMKKVAE